MNQVQTDFLQEIITDNFAGFGGASWGIEQATGRTVDVAVNHSRMAIRMHQTNHPYTRHYKENVWDIDPVAVCQGRPVGLAWFSPDCKHFSKAKGDKPKDKHIRGLAWVACKWAALVRPRVIMLENVEEFQDWGPLGRKGKPIKSKKGQTFQKFVGQLRAMGYQVEYRELVAADYGAPTTRKRFFLVARCDGKPIVWPEPTHAPIGSEDVKSGRKLPWRASYEIIDWSLPCPSIFDSKQDIKDKYGLKAQRPLKPNTVRRIIRGVDKFTIKSGKPFILQQKFQNGPQSIDNPLSTVTAVGAHNAVAPSLIQYHTELTDHVRASGLDVPINTVDAANRYGLTAASLVEYYGNGNPLDVTEPLHTVTGKDREAVVAAHICKFKGQDIGHGAYLPLHTVTASPGEFAAVETRIVQYREGMDLQHWPKVRQLLNEYCGYSLADNEVLLLGIAGIWYFIADIGMRMLTPRELYAANGFPEDYIIDRDFEGNEISKADQVAGCGNAVVPALAAALVRANLPEWCQGKDIRTKADWERQVAV